MTLAVVHARALDGLDAQAVAVEVQLANGLPCFQLVGLAETEVKESRERVRAALQQSGFGFPHNKRITVNLAPADLPKDSGRFDLPIALGILAAQGVVEPAALAPFEFAGELSLAGALRPVRGALAIALAMRRSGSTRTLVLPKESASAAARVAGLDVRAAVHLNEVVRALLPGERAEPLPRAQPEPALAAAAAPDLSDVKGQAAPKRALEIAAAGSHSLLFVGPPGSGKSMLAQRLAGLLPPLDEEDALTSAALASLGAAGFDPARFGQRPLRSPHHSASAPALVGGGSPPRPGEISLAHAGVLFLDELPEFPRSALEALREPLETGRITLARAARQAQYPARFQLVAAMNPCPCGWHGAGAAADIGQGGASAAGAGAPWPACRCSPDQVARYRGRISGPLLDRIDLRVEVAPVSIDALMRAAPAAGDGADACTSESSAVVAARVAAARERQRARQQVPNALLAPAALEQHARPDTAAETLLRHAATRLGWSGRRLHRTLKVARTIADLAAADCIGSAHAAEAIQLQRAIG